MLKFIFQSSPGFCCSIREDYRDVGVNKASLRGRPAVTIQVIPDHVDKPLEFQPSPFFLNATMKQRQLSAKGIHSILQLVTVSPASRTLVAHHAFPSTTCFCASSETPDSPGHEYMQMCGLIMRLARSLFQLSLLMVDLQLNYTMFVVWLAVLIFTLRRLFHWWASQAAVSSSCPVTVSFPPPSAVGRTQVTSRSWPSPQTGDVTKMTRALSRR